MRQRSPRDSLGDLVLGALERLGRREPARFGGGERVNRGGLLTQKLLERGAAVAISGWVGNFVVELRLARADRGELGLGLAQRLPQRTQGLAPLCRRAARLAPGVDGAAVLPCRLRRPR